jgi:hypothetical protein
VLASANLGDDGIRHENVRREALEELQSIDARQQDERRGVDDPRLTHE